MILHTDILGTRHIYDAADAATRATGGDPGRDAVRPTRFELRGSRKRARAYDVILTGSNRRGQNGDPRTPAATYDEWGYFLAYLFGLDSEMIAGPYNGAGDFHAKTGGDYAARSWKFDNRGLARA